MMFVRYPVRGEVAPAVRSGKNGNSTMLEKITRCEYCGREHDQSAQGRAETPYCSRCLGDRLRLYTPAKPPTWKRVGLTEVGDHRHVVVVEQDVGRFDVEMDQAFRVDATDAA